ncbi:MAG: calcium/sodium antiporter [Verrucomicrobiales bacterium]|nr:calcium/sodium antiporter [Verrucomicrobiales bacterium]
MSGIWWDIFLMVAGLVALVVGAEWLVRGSAKLAVMMGVSPLVVGLTIVAFGTSSPELFVCLKFNLAGDANAALGNLVGSNICNIGLILGISALIRPLDIKAQLLVRDLPILFVVSAGVIFMLWDGVIEVWEGGILVLGVVVYTVYSFRASKKEDNPEVLEEFEDEYGQASGKKNDGWMGMAGLILVGLVGLYFGAEWLVDGAVGIAERMNVPSAFISLTVIAFGTSLPELATSIVAVIRRQGDIISGNAIGSCIFNLLLVLGATAMVKRMVITAIEPVDLAVMMGMVVIVVPLMWTRRRLARPEGALLLVIYLGYTVYLWFDRVQGA